MKGPPVTVTSAPALPSLKDGGSSLTTARGVWYQNATLGGAATTSPESKTREKATAPASSGDNGGLAHTAEVGDNTVATVSVVTSAFAVVLLPLSPISLLPMTNPLLSVWPWNWHRNPKVVGKLDPVTVT
jgi:hypothetical protein